ncbi:unnamed protein product [Periconia digitata]|uniref:Uncharacterized protein n=1 Tax=Periconia digitata TaxID=1303443 RepID=A0A9W4UR23_9PLEO|nr:unnamed protein product [Periconia digitata]
MYVHDIPVRHTPLTCTSFNIHFLDVNSASFTIPPILLPQLQPPLSISSFP